jgi:aspartate aminotransferase
MAISKKARTSIERSSWIRQMFEEGARLKARYGPNNVFDFSLGNPNLEPPAKIKTILQELTGNDAVGTHGYMSNAGFVETRKAVAAYLSGLNGLSLDAQDIVMTVGAAGGLNVIFKTILDPGDEVIVPAPYFMEYNAYIDNHGGVPVTVITNSDFSLDLSTIEAAITLKTKAVLINTPNNPTGKVYPKEELDKLGEILIRYSFIHDRTIYLISDEPYSKIVYNGVKCNSALSSYRNSFMATSFSKDLSLPGERIGYLAIHPSMDQQDTVVEGLVFCHRTLGFVNAPALMQRLVPYVLEESVDVSQYQKKRDILCEGLEKAGYQFTVPEGTFYLFPKSPISDDVAFVQALQRENILTVPGTGFGCSGHFRIAFCVDDRTIANALPGFTRVLEKFGKVQTYKEEKISAVA